MATLEPAGGRRASLPSGTVTFAFTDIEGSTQRWERDRPAMEAAVRRHDALLRASIAAHDGEVFKTIGDAFCAAFRRPEDAARAMLAAQRSLAAEDFSAVGGLRVRAALHAGTADERDGDYFGPTLNRVARLLALGHGGQVLVSGVTSELLRGVLPPDASLIDLGEHRLKDLTRPEHVFQLLVPEMPRDFPPLRSLDAHANNLPAVLTSLVGRETEVAEVAALLAARRLVTLVGSGGIGKTRVSLQVAANALDGFAGGVWFVELAPVASGDYLPATVAQAMGLTLPSEGDPLEHLVRALRDKRALLVLDNCEHVIESAARAAAALLRGCPQLAVLASSRQALGIAGEATYRMPALGFPGEVQAATLSALDAASFPAIELFVSRAQAADGRFALADENAASIAEICRRLDGIPLALELAASRVRILSPRQLRERLDERFRMLTNGRRDALPRQQTLRALIDWSYDLLDEREKALFRHLSIFVDPFPIEGASAVGSSPDVDELEVFDLLGSLVDKSLVLAEPDGDALRYRMLESTRAYACGKLEDAGEREAQAARHLQYLTERFEGAAQLWEQTGRGSEIVRLLATGINDVRAALDWSLTRDVPAGSALLAAIDSGWASVGLAGEAQRRLEAQIAAFGSSEAGLAARLWITLGYLTLHDGHAPKSREVAATGLELARASGDAAILVSALAVFADAVVRLRLFDEAEGALAEAEAISVRSEVLRGRLLEARAFLSSARGDLDSATRAFEQQRDDGRAVGSRSNVLATVANLAEIEHERGQTRRAIELAREALPAARAGPRPDILASLLANLAGYLAAAGEPLAAIQAARDSIEVQAPLDPGSFLIAIALEHLALALAQLGDLSRAAQLSGYVDASMLALGFEREYTEAATHERLGALLAKSAIAGQERLIAEGAALGAEAALALALGGVSPS